jgi:hypothetical protein
MQGDSKRTDTSQHYGSIPWTVIIDILIAVTILPVAGSTQTVDESAA